MTVTIDFFNTPFDKEPTLFQAETVAHWILEHKEELTNYAIYEGQPSQQTDITQNVEKLMLRNGHYIVLLSPCGDALAFLSPSAYLSLKINDYLISKLVPTPDVPSNINRTQQSSNNSLAGRTNEARVLQRIEDIFGLVRAYPSLIQPVYSKYINNKQYEYSYMCIGRGWYDVADVRDGETLLSDIDGTSAEFFNPFTSPNSGSPFLSIGSAISEPILLVKRSNNVTGEVLKAHNQFVLTYSGSMVFYKASTIPSSYDRIGSISDEMYANASPSDVITITGTPAASHDGSYTIRSKIGVSNILELTTATFPSASSTSGTFTITTGNPEYTSWVTLKDENMTQVWVNLVAQQGLFYDAGSGKTTLSVDYAIETQALDGSYLPTGAITTTTGTMTAATSDEQAKTIEITTGHTGATRVRARRTNDHDYGFAGTVIDEIKYQDLYAVTPITATDFGNVTTVQVVSKATQRATSLKERKFNCNATRKLPTFNGTTFSGAFASNGSVASGTISATKSFIDILAAASIDSKIGQRVLANDVDMSQIWGVRNTINTWNPLNIEFGYTLDSDNISFEETVRMIADSVFCIAYRQNGKIRFSFDNVQASSTALFTHRNKKPASDTISRLFAADSEFNGIELTYNDNVSDAQETIKLPLSLTATNYKKIELTGVRNYAQAWFRANREYNKILLQRVSIETETTSDGRLLLPNQRIDIVDNTRFDSQDGEIIAQSGLILTLSRDVVFGVGTHSIILMQRDGGLESITCTAGASANKVVLAYAPSEAINTVNGGAIGIRTIFSFGADSVASANSYLVQEVNITDSSYVKVTAINYDADYYSADTESIPSRSTVL
ncbi:MAG: hypothetical protein IPF69_00835 [Chitinophagaceae bacterium]|nr:hypothetical protein [Chitinophagaceae bacterium]